VNTNCLDARRGWWGDVHVEWKEVKNGSMEKKEGDGASKPL
jgi:hypothetical protein